MINKWMLIGVVAGLGIATAGAVVAYSMRDNTDQEMAAQTMSDEMPAEDAVADVAEMSAPAAPAVAQVSTPAPHPATSPPAKKAKAPKPEGQVAQAPVPAKEPAQHCWDEEVTHTAEPKDEHRIAGTVIGGVVGAAVGNQFGGGKGKTLATVAGAAGGAYAGNRAQKAVQENNTYTTTEHHCEPVQ
jgi:uncharacterized protein YcfJ